MSPESATPEVAMRQRVSQVRTVIATGNENTQSNVWRPDVGAPTRSMVEYQMRLGWLLDVLRFGQIFLDERNPLLLVRSGVHRDTNIGAWNYCLLMLRQCIARLLEPGDLLLTPIVRHEEKLENIRRLQTLEPQAEDRMGLDRGNDMSFCYHGRP